MKLLLTKKGSSFFTDEESVQKLKDGDSFLVDLKKVRSARQHRLYWALLSLSVHHQTEPAVFSNAEQLSDCLKVSLGYVEDVYGPDGNVIGIKPLSISFAEMDGLEFTEFLNRAIEFIILKVVPMVSAEAFENEIYNMIGSRGPLDVDRTV